MVIKLLLILLLLLAPLYFLIPHKEVPLMVKPIVVQSQSLPTSDIETESESKIITPSIDQIFAEDHSWTKSLPSDKKRVLIATGDVIPARVVNIQATKYRDFKWPYETTADVLKDADITFINLETPLIKNCPLVNDGMKFCGDERNIEGLVFAGVDVASLANNHAGNYGTNAIFSTVELLNINGILVTGIDGPVYKNIRGITFAFLGYNDIGKVQPGVSNAQEDKIQTDIAQAKQNADIIVVTFHWGAEYKDQPDERQKYLGRFAIDAGADLVIGNHPHWIQPVEIYKDKLITYAHGNFVFDQEWSLKTKQGVIGRYTFLENRLVDIEYLPVQIENFGKPSFLEGVKKKSILDKMWEESLRLSVSPL